MKTGRFALRLLAVLLIVGLLTFDLWAGARAAQATASPPSPAVPVLQAEGDPGEAPEPGSGEPAAPMTRAEHYQLIREDLLATVEQENPRAAMAKLRLLMKEDPVLLRNCHPFTHQIGRRAYQRYQSFAEAVSYRDEICNSGYLHGVIEAYFLSVPDPVNAMLTICDDYERGKFMSWQCFHGVGHGAMFYRKNDLPSALTLCERYSDSFGRMTCANGAFMENFNGDGMGFPSRFRSAEDPFFPCNNQVPTYQSTCYLYAPTYYLTLHERDYDGILGLCATVPSLVGGACTQGVGAEAIKQNLDDPALVEALCSRGANWQHDPCITGMVGLYVNHHGALDPARQLCDQLQPENRDLCSTYVRGVEGLF